jgi:hypothetical protein
MAETPYQRYQRFLGNPAGSLGLPTKSRLGSAVNSAGNYLSENLPVFAEAINQGNPFTLPQRAAEWLVGEQPDAPVTPASVPEPSIGTPSAKPPLGRGLDFDSVPGADDRGVTDFIRRPMREFAPGVRVQDSPRTSGDAQAIERMRGASHLRPLLNVRGENGGPLSAADMENNQRAMDTLDDYFVNAPNEQRLGELQSRSKELQFESDIEDPLWRQRAQADIELGKGMGFETFKSQLTQGREQERRQAFGAEMQDLLGAQQERQSEIDRLPPGPERDTEQRNLDEMVKATQQSLREKYGLGAGLSSAFGDRT